MSLPGGPTDMYWNQRVTPASLFGLRPGAPAPRTAAGSSLPPTSAGANDGAHIPWHPDSPVFWGVAIIALTIAGMTGASVRVRAFKRHASAELGDS